jgi:hypothetical protein
VGWGGRGYIGSVEVAMNSKFNYGACDCCKRMSLRYYLGRVIEEGLEWLEHPCVDEFGDTMAGLSQAISIVIHHEIMLPYASKAFEKGRRRVQEHGCVRSSRNKCS